MYLMIFTITLTSPSIKKCVYFCISIMLHFAFHSVNSESHEFFFSIKGQPVSKVVWLSSSKANSHLQHSCKQKRENVSLWIKKFTSIREEVTTLQAELERLSTLVVSLVALQNQSQFQQGPERQHQQQPRQQASRMQFDPIPMTYAELLPILLKENLVQTRESPHVPNELLIWYQSDLSYAFHQVAPDHDIEHCFSLKIEVQKLIEANILLFEYWIRTCKLIHYQIILPSIVTHGVDGRNWVAFDVPSTTYLLK